MILLSILKKSKKISFLIFSLTLFMCFHSVIYAEPQIRQQQGIIITGTVSDKKEPIIGVNVSIKGTSIGTETDQDGKYSVTVPDKESRLVFTYVGYNSQELVVGNQTTLNVIMTESSQDIDEVVVVGYGVQKKVNVVGAVSTLQGSVIKSVPAASAGAAIAGRLPGVTVLQTTGEPGTAGYMNPRIYIRGRSTLGDDASKTDPLVIIDGVPGRSLGEIDPNDISSFSVLKDASAAIYGAQAANGVILVTTKSGEAGKPKLNFNFYYGAMTPSKIPEMCNAAEYATMLSEFETGNGSARTYTDNDIALFASGADPWEHPNTDWYGELIKKWTTSSRYNLSINGGSTGGMTYYVSLGYKKDDAMYKQSSTSYDQINLRTKLFLPITKWLSADVSIAGFKDHNLYPYRSASDIIGSATRSLPTRPAFWPTGEPAPDIENGDNPVVTSSFAGGKNEQDTYRLQNFLQATISPPFVPGLKLSASVNYDLSNYYRKRFYQPWNLYFADFTQATRDPNTGFVTSVPLNPVLRQPTGVVLPELINDYNRTINTTGKIELNYARTFGDHDITVYAGFEQYTSNYNEFSATRVGYISTLIQILNVGPDLNKDNSGTSTIYARKSWIGRATYAYKSKYLAEVLFRRDGSLKFPPKSRWGNFPGFMLGWRASEEDFWKKDLSFINYFKIRASYGEMGMDPGNPFQYSNKYQMGTVLGMVFGTGGVIGTTVGPPTFANPVITWEVQKTKNIGFDSEFLKGLLFLNFDYFYNIRDHILIPPTGAVPDFAGITLPNENMARVDDHGVEIEAGIRKSINDWKFSFSGNLGYARNKLVYINEVAPPVAWQVKTGLPYGTVLMYQAMGIYKDQAAVDASATVVGGAKPGDIIYKDVNNDGKIDGLDQILLDHTTMPDLTYGATLNVSWKNFTLTVLLQGQGTYYKADWTDVRRGDEGNYFKFMYTNRWTPDNPDGTMPRAFNRSSPYWVDPNSNTFWWANTAYLRLKNVQLSYSIPKKLYKPAGISDINIYFTGNNLAYLYSATNIFDPEAANINSYPTMKTFAIGANVNF